MNIKILDTFTGTDGTTIGSHMPDTGNAWMGASNYLVIENNQLVFNGEGPNETEQQVNSCSKHYYIQFTPLVAAQGTYVYLRNSNSDTVSLRLSANLVELVSGSTTEASVSESISYGSVYRMEITPATVSSSNVIVTRDGTEIINAPVFFTPRFKPYVGISLQGRMDSFEVGTGAEPTVWNGFIDGTSFSKPALADWTSTEFQDAITPQTIITRANTQGLFNIAVETGYDGGISVMNTEWAFAGKQGNPVSGFRAENYANLVFTSWAASTGFFPPSVVGIPGVIHLIEEDIYLDVKVLSWGEQGSGGGSFSWIRSNATSTRYIDTVPPTISLFDMPSYYCSNYVPVYALKATDDDIIDSYALTLSADTPQEGDWVIISPPSDRFSLSVPQYYEGYYNNFYVPSGTNTVYGWVKDQAGNMSYAVKEVTVDTTEGCSVYTISVSYNNGGGYTGADYLSTKAYPQYYITQGGNCTINVVPMDGYKVTSMIVDGTENVGTSGTYTFTNIDNNHTLYIEVHENAWIPSYPITTTINSIGGLGNGYANPSYTEVLQGGSSLIEFHVSNGYSTITDVTIDGVSHGNIGSYFFTNVQGPHDIVVSITSTLELLGCGTASSTMKETTYTSGQPFISYESQMGTINSSVGVNSTNNVICKAFWRSAGEYNTVQIIVIHSNDNGATWNENIVYISDNQETMAWEPYTTSRPDGTMYVGFLRNSVDSPYPHYAQIFRYGSSTDGVNWSWHDVNTGAIYTNNMGNVTADIRVGIGGFFATDDGLTVWLNKNDMINGVALPRVTIGASEPSGDYGLYNTPNGIAFDLNRSTAWKQGNETLGLNGSIVCKNSTGQKIVVEYQFFSSNCWWRGYTHSLDGGATWSALTFATGDVISGYSLYSTSTYIFDTAFVSDTVIRRCKTAYNYPSYYEYATLEESSDYGATWTTVASLGGSYLINGSAGNHTLSFCQTYGGKWAAVTKVLPGDRGFWGYPYSYICSTGCFLTVPASETFTIDAYADVNGIIAPSGYITLDKGYSIDFNIIPDSGYDISDVVVDSISEGALTSKTFSNISANHTISASFAAQGGSSYTETVTSIVTSIISGINANEVTTHFVTTSIATLSEGGTLDVGGGTGRAYFGGGTNGTNMTEIDGIRCDTDTAINPSTVLSSGRHGLSGVQSSTTGYFGGGNGSNPSAMSNVIDGINFSNEVAVTISATLSAGRGQLAGVNSSTKGYFAGGYPGNMGPLQTNEIDGIRFDTNAAINPSATLAVARFGLSGMYSASRGYFAGGSGLGANAWSSEIDGIRFDTEAATNPTATLTRGRYYHVGISGPTKGFICGGWLYGNDYTTSIESFDLSSGVVAAETAHLSLAKTFATGSREAGASAALAGYMAGGYNDTRFEKLQFSTITAGSLSATLPVTRTGAAGVASLTDQYTAPVETFTITAAVSNKYGGKGSITSPGNTTLSIGSSKTYTFTPQEGYEVESVTLDGTTVANRVLSYDITNLRNNHILIVTFSVAKETVCADYFG